MQESSKLLETWNKSMMEWIDGGQELPGCRVEPAWCGDALAMMAHFGKRSPGID